MTEKFIEYQQFTVSSAGNKLDEETKNKISRFQARHFGKTALQAVKY